MKIGIQLAVGAIGYMLLRLAGMPIEVFLVLLVALVIGWPLGWFIGTLISDHTDVDTRLFKFVGWANLIAWVIPIAGVAVSTLTSRLGKGSIKHELFYDGMAIIGQVLVVMNVLIASYFVADGRVAESAESPTVAISSERSFERCPYAAMEHWTKDEIETHCNRDPSAEELRTFEIEQANSRQG